jgi:signal transduction histidine kinase
MRLSIKTKQVLGVTSTVGAVVIALSLYHLTSLARVSLQESQARGELLARAIYQRAHAIVPYATDRYVALREDGGLKSILEASIYSKDVTDAAVVDAGGVIVAHYDPSRIGKKVPRRAQVQDLLQLNGPQQLWAIYTDPGRELEVREPLTLDNGKEFGAIRIGISTLLIRKGLREGLRPAVGTVLIALVAATFMAMLLAQLFLRPIHVLRSGLSRLQRGETGITLDLPKDEFGDLGTFFNAVSQKLSADRSELAGQKANLESVVERLEDAIALFDTGGDLLFANPTMRALLPLTEGGREPAPWQELVRTTIATRQSRGPVGIMGPESDQDGGEHSGEWLLMTHAIQDAEHRLIGVMLVGRNLGYLSEVQSTLRYSRKLTALGRLSAGVAHEVKNPLNAMMIHLELLRQKLSAAPAVRAATAAASRGPTTLQLGAVAAPARVDVSTAVEHVNVIAGEIKRLDQVLQGFLKFSRPEDLRLQPVAVPGLLDEVVQVVRPEAEKTHVRITSDCPAGTPAINADAGMLRQALLNLAINACQSMPNGGTLSLRARPVRNRRVQITVEDTGIGIKPEHLQRIFDLYFTTREKGSGIGLSMVYRTVQLHDGDIEVQSTPGVGTTFRLLLPQA